MRRKAFARRSKTGCRTCRFVIILYEFCRPLISCRTRRVKCDETPGACKTCTSSGWKCEGYDVALLARASKKAHKTDFSLTLQHVTSNFPGDTAEERRQFAFFQRLTVPGLTGFFNSRLWTDLVLPMCHSERAVIHGVVALSALHEDLEVRGAPLSRENLTNRHHRFALCQYGRSLATLNERRHSQDPRLRDVILTCCLLFVAFDLLRGQYDPALFHLKQGLAIIHEEYRDSEELPGVSNTMRCIEESLLRMMTRLETQSVFFGLTPLATLAPGVIAEENSPFTSLAEAQVALDQILARAIRFLATTYNCPLEERLPERHPELAQMQDKIRLELESYTSRLALSTVFLLSLQDKKGQRGLNLIYLHHITFTILVENALTGEYQDTYNYYLDHFKRVLALSRWISDSFQEGTSGSRPTLLLDMGIIPSLFFVCWKCHEPSLRQQALDLLEEWPHREGLWDSRLLVIFAKQLIQLELESLASSSSPKAPMRILDSSLEVSDDQTRATIRYKTRQSGQEVLEQSRIVLFDENI